MKFKNYSKILWTSGGRDDKFVDGFNGKCVRGGKKESMSVPGYWLDQLGGGY